MKIKHLLIIFTVIFNLTLSAQTEDYFGDYERKSITKKGENFKWMLSLNADGTFLYNFYRNLNCDICTEENFYVKGTWKAKNKLIYFYADKNDIDETHTLNFNNSKARINSKSPRDKSAKVIKESIRFYSSEESVIKGLELFKTD